MFRCRETAVFPNANALLLNGSACPFAPRKCSIEWSPASFLLHSQMLFRQSPGALFQ
ncbi:hypothetical protein B4096_2426 [Heyndrickxia coagulans]|nr:hypothetical protein B4100_2539 [Heyndrickxia coagulans]KYC71945.1 hypothetical protein B4096_2426 [Heyndrickxia coagulans]